MIHSLSGGVIADDGIYTFVKVDAEGTPRWYLAPVFRPKAGDRVRVPLGGGECVATVLRVESCSRQTAPVPLNRVQSILEIFPAEND